MRGRVNEQALLLPHGREPALSAVSCRRNVRVRRSRARMESVLELR